MKKLFAFLALASVAFFARGEDFIGKPQAVIDLGTPEGVALLKGQWRYSDTKIFEAEFRAAGPEGHRPAGS